MTNFETIYLMIEFGIMLIGLISLIVAIIALLISNNTKK